MSCAPWWGRQYERLIGLVKQAMYENIGDRSLHWKELDVETALDNHPLDYVEDDIQLPLLTPNALLFGQANLVPEIDPNTMESTDLRKRDRYLCKYKDILWSRWCCKYIRALREHHNLKHGTKVLSVKPGDIVLIQGDNRNQGKWKIGIVNTLILGNDGIVRVVRLRAGKSYIEHAIQHLYPLELSCDMPAKRNKTPLDAQAPEFKPKTVVAVIAQKHIRTMANEEVEDDDY